MARSKHLPLIYAGLPGSQSLRDLVNTGNCQEKTGPEGVSLQDRYFRPPRVGLLTDSWQWIRMDNDLLSPKAEGSKPIYGTKGQDTRSYFVRRDLERA